jgi:type IV fimbrial biogenesis protein FimT
MAQRDKKMPRRVTKTYAGPLQAGVTLIELMVVLMVLAVVVTLSVPSFNALIRNNRIYTQVNDFHLALMRARSEAMSRVQRVTVCASSDGASCSGTGQWEDGWVIFAEDPNSMSMPPAINTSDGDEILEIKQALSGDTTLRGDSALANYVSYMGTGFTTTTGKLALCDTRGLSWSRTILINAAGRPRIIYSDETGSASSCTSP